MTEYVDRLSAPVRAVLERGGCVATAAAQQAYQIRLAWAERQQAAGLASWRTPDVLPLNAALSRAWRLAVVDGADLPALLNPAQERALWERVIRETDGERRFLQPHGTARAAMRAWRRLIEWNIALPALAQAPGEEARAFHEWALAFRKHCHAGHWVDPASALERWPLEREERRPWVLVGFDAPTVAVRALGERMRERGIEMQFSHGPAAAGHVVSASFSDTQDEWRAAASWSRERLQENPRQRLQVVIADLDRQRERIERIFDEILQPAALLGIASARVPFAIEGGIPLARYPLADTALLAIALAVEAQPFEAASRWLRSPFLTHAQGAAADRVRLDVELRRNAAHELDLEGLRRALERAAARLGVAEPLVEAAGALGIALAGRRGLAEWSATVSRALRALGWPGACALDSAQHQTLEKFNDCLAELAMLDDIVGPVDARGLLHHLRALAEQTRFQPETGDTPVTLSARLAAPVLALDGLWVCGLHSGAWPRAARPDPFLPWDLQRDAGMPEASAQAMLAQAERLTTRWAGTAREVVLSWPMRIDDEECLPSPLIAAYPQDAGVGRSESAAGGYWRRVRDSARLEEIEDSRAPALPPGAPLPSGAFAITLQSLCAIRAFADRRLLAQPLEQPQPGIDPRTRGILTHEALALLWGELGSQQRLRSLDDSARSSLVASVAARAADKHLPPWRWPSRLRSLECERLAALLHEWLAVELARPPFRVVAREQSVPAQLAGHPMELRIDRIDEWTDDGRRQLLDYKTGALTPAAWFGERPEDAQLPLYAIVLRPPVDGIAVARVRPGACSLSGESSAPSMTGNRRPLDWDAQLAAWERTLGRLAQEFADGDARVNPKLAVTCRRCHLHSFCRIDELMGGGECDEEEVVTDDA